MTGIAPSGVIPVIDFFASEYYYVDHLVSIWQALPAQARGIWWVTEKCRKRLAYYGVPRREAHIRRDKRELAALLRVKGKAPTLSASVSDWRKVARTGLPAPYLPHGPGGPGHNAEEFWRENSKQVPVMLVAAERAVFEGVKTVVLGGQPKVDRWLGQRPGNERPVVVLSFRWRESHCALEAYRSQLVEFGKEAEARGWEVWGHGHPLAYAEKFRPLWRSMGWKHTGDFEKVMRIADVYAADASGTSFEFMATGRPVVFLDSPIYDEDLRGRMWHRFSHAYGGVTCEGPGELTGAVAEALADSAAQQEARAKVVRQIFSVNDGKSSVRAARALLEVFA